MRFGSDSLLLQQGRFFLYNISHFFIGLLYIESHILKNQNIVKSKDKSQKCKEKCSKSRIISHNFNKNFEKRCIICIAQLPR